MSTPVLKPRARNNEPVLVSTPVLNSQHAHVDVWCDYENGGNTVVQPCAWSCKVA